MLRNTEPRSWVGLWYLPDDECKHHGELSYDPDDGFNLRLFSEGFESPYVEIDAPTKIFQPSTMGGVYGPRDFSRPYPAIYGETEGRIVTLFDVHYGGGTQRYGGQAPYSTADYFPELMVIGAKIPSRDLECFKSIDVSIDFLHVWLGDTGWMQVGSKNKLVGHSEREYFTKVEVPFRDVRHEKYLHEDGTSYSIGYEGILPGLKLSAFEYQSSSSVSAILKMGNTDRPVALDTYRSKISAVETMISICMDRVCRAHGYSATVKCDGQFKTVDLVIPRVGAVPSSEASNKVLNVLVQCNEDGDFKDFLQNWFALVEGNRSVTMLNGFLALAPEKDLESSLLLTQSMFEAESV